MTTLPINQDDSTYDELVRKYQLLKIHCLNQLLKRHKMPKQVRKAIAEELMFEEGSCFDSGWIRHKGIQLFPTLTFAERPVHPVDGIGDIAKVHLPANSSGIHEYAGGTVDIYFEEDGESIDKIDCGFD